MVLVAVVLVVVALVVLIFPVVVLVVLIVPVAVFPVIVVVALVVSVVVAATGGWLAAIAGVLRGLLVELLGGGGGERSLRLPSRPGASHWTQRIVFVSRQTWVPACVDRRSDLSGRYDYINTCRMI